MERLLKSQIQNHLKSNKILLLFGPKCVGKSELISEIVENKSDLLSLDAEDKNVIQLFHEPSENSLKNIFKDKSYILIENAQQLFDLQKVIEIILFQEMNVNLILSCSFEPILQEELRSAIRSQGLELTLYPYLFQELAKNVGIVEFDKTLERHLIFGNYPKVVNANENKVEILQEILQEAIFTHFRPNERINKENKLLKMLQILAFEIGNPISYNDVGFKSGLDNETVERYVDLLEKSFILIKIPSFYNEKKYELKKTNVIYFIDNGIRNALIHNFNDFDMRNDQDVLWKNWLISERIKFNRLNHKTVDYFFWRTHTRQQIDFIEKVGDNIRAYQSIWDKRKKPKFPSSFSEYYPDANLHTLNKSTYWGFLSKN